MEQTALIKWPGGKASEIQYIEPLIPQFKRYIEPFFGGGALFFHLMPENSIINDISYDLMSFYRLIKEHNSLFATHLYAYNSTFESLLLCCEESYPSIQNTYKSFEKSEEIDPTSLRNDIRQLVNSLDQNGFDLLVLDRDKFEDHLYKQFVDKCKRTVKNNLKVPFSETDLKNNLITGFTSGFYMYFRNVYNDIHLNRISNISLEYSIANFYFIREYCYGSMFRYNKKGEFNIPYGGMTYNHKDFRSKIDMITTPTTASLFQNTDLFCLDFEDFFSKVELSKDDFMFLDPPYDSDFSNYEGVDFTQMDQIRLFECLKTTKAQFILVIKNTDFIYSLYKDNFTIYSFDKQYTYNVRQRNDRNAEHLIITNIK